jgi:hypothetical protein
MDDGREQIATTPNLLCAFLIPCETVLLEKDGTPSAIRLLTSLFLPAPAAGAEFVDVLFVLKFEPGYSPTGQEFSVDVIDPTGVTETLTRVDGATLSTSNEMVASAIVHVNLTVHLNVSGSRSVGTYRLRGYLNGQEVANTIPGASFRRIAAGIEQLPQRRSFPEYPPAGFAPAAYVSGAITGFNRCLGFASYNLEYYTGLPWM